jgi:hypothetical protein
VALLTLASALPGIAAFTAEGAAASGLTAGDLSVGTGIMAFVAFTSGARRTARAGSSTPRGGARQRRRAARAAQVLT